MRMLNTAKTPRKSDLEAVNPETEDTFYDEDLSLSTTKLDPSPLLSATYLVLNSNMFLDLTYSLSHPEVI